MILTERLRIAPFTEDQAEAFFELTQDDGFNAYPITIYRQDDLASARKWIAANASLLERARLGKWAIWDRRVDTLLGMGGLTPWNLEDEYLVDITYRLRQSAWGKGYGTESAIALVEHGFKTLGLTEITATITPDNLPSKKVAARLGMKFDRRILLKGVQTDLYRLQRSIE